jgi:hypothetical protein
MIFFTFAALSATVVFLPLAHALPTARSTSLSSTQMEPGSLLGRPYILHQKPSPAVATVHEPEPLLDQNDDVTRESPLRRTIRFQVVQRRLAFRNRGKVVERRAEHEVDLLSNQGPPPPMPPTTQTVAPAVNAIPTPQAHLVAPNTSITLIPRPSPTAHAKHSKGSGKKVGKGGVVKKSERTKKDKSESRQSSKLKSRRHA